MESMYDMKVMEKPEEMEPYFYLIKQLNPKMEEGDFKKMLPAMVSGGYKQVGVFQGETCLGLSGFWVGTKLYCGKYIEMDNVVIDQNYRSMGIGKMLWNWIREEGIRQGCRVAMLDARVENKEAQKFYFREGFGIKGFHFVRKL